MNTASQEQISTAAKMDDLDAACAFLQAIIGQTDGGYASLFFSGFDDEYGDWQKSSEKQRADWLVEYLEFERIHADSEK